MADDSRQSSVMPKLEPDIDTVKQKIKQEHLYCHEIKAEPFKKGKFARSGNASKITVCVQTNKKSTSLKRKNPSSTDSVIFSQMKYFSLPATPSFFHF